MTGAARGRFITLEGGEGAGKSVQAKRLEEKLASMGLNVVRTREPGGSPHAEELRQAILSGFAAQLGPDGEALLFAAARIDHLDNTIVPALERGAWVVCDRFADSTRVYQGVAGKVSPRLHRASGGRRRRRQRPGPHARSRHSGRSRPRAGAPPERDGEPGPIRGRRDRISRDAPPRVPRDRGG